jgi:cytochrome c553
MHAAITPSKRKPAMGNRRHSLGWWLLIAGATVLMTVLVRTSAAQTQRGIDIIERALELRPNVENGRLMYGEHCVSCHGSEAWGDADTVTPALAGQLPVYVIKQLADIAEGQRIAPEMHRVVARKAVSTLQALRDIASYLGELTPNPNPEVGDGMQLALGKRHYQGLCAYCHGAQGGGNEAHATPALRRQNYAYLLMQMRNLANEHRYSVDIEIVETLQALSFDQLSAIADYTARLPMVNENALMPVTPNAASDSGGN